MQRLHKKILFCKISKNRLVRNELLNSKCENCFEGVKNNGG